MLPQPGFSVGSGIWTQVLTLEKQALYLLNHLSSLKSPKQLSWRALDKTVTPPGRAQTGATWTSGLGLRGLRAQRKRLESLLSDLGVWLLILMAVDAFLSSSYREINHVWWFWTKWRWVSWAGVRAILVLCLNRQLRSWQTSISIYLPTTVLFGKQKPMKQEPKYQLL